MTKKKQTLKKSDIGSRVGIKDLQLYSSDSAPLDPNRPFFLLGIDLMKGKQYAFVAFSGSNDVYRVLATKIIL
mgnify:CR=1 FL=1